MTTKQQQDAVLYFREHAEDWARKAASSRPGKVNVIQQRNDFVLHMIGNRKETHVTLDVGCGTGDLVCDIARRGIHAIGVDFAAEMIEIARSRARKESLEKARFQCCSVFEMEFSGRKYDMISANGFIEYISFDELDRFLGIASQALSTGGSLVLGSRNRLFNLFSLNSFTIEEVESGVADLLVREAVSLASGIDIMELAKMEAAPLQKPGLRHANTGINVSTRYQFTPVQLIRLLKAKGLSTTHVYPIHVHGVPSAFKDRNPEIHAGISNLLQAYAAEYRSLVPYSSSFMLHAEKTG